jgi:hypothetical protein
MVTSWTMSEAARIAIEEAQNAAMASRAELKPEFLYATPAKSTSIPILTLGAVASGGLYLAGMSIGIVLAPIAAAIAYIAWRK